MWITAALTLSVTQPVINEVRLLPVTEISCRKNKTNMTTIYSHHAHFSSSTHVGKEEEERQNSPITTELEWVEDKLGDKLCGPQIHQLNSLYFPSSFLSSLTSHIICLIKWLIKYQRTNYAPPPSPTPVKVARKSSLILDMNLLRKFHSSPSHNKWWFIKARQLYKLQSLVLILIPGYKYQFATCGKAIKGVK